MPEIDLEKIGLKVGLEIHQQLATGRKLFCNCIPAESDEYSHKFSRKLRISKSEMGEYDPAALFEASKSKNFVYYSNPKSSCLVEFDEEPPHDLNEDSKRLVLTIAESLKSHVFEEIYPMRKMVIDGSNTSGFQRTMIVSQGGTLKVDGREVGVQSICLEEDAARLLKDSQKERSYSLDRLGIPLIEIALDPVSAKPSEIRNIALSLGRLLRTTKKVLRGLGSIRQDVNVSVSNGAVAEVKGVQQLDQLEKVIEYEAKRQHGLLKIAEKLQERKFELNISKHDIIDITQEFRSCNSKIIQKAIKENSKIKLLKIKNFSGMFAFSPYEGIRFGKELGQLVKFFGIGGIFHSDELPNYGIEEKDLHDLKKKINFSEKDGFLIIAGDPAKINLAIDSILNRIGQATNGAPPETRLATSNGETVYLRPRPGASRMYPETDIPPILVSQNDLEFARKNIPKSWNESIKQLQEKYALNSQLAEQIFDSDYFDLFEKICEMENSEPNFIASVLCSTITSLERQGLDSNLLKEHDIFKSFKLLSNEEITKESLEIIFQGIMSGKSKSVEDVIKESSLGSVNEEEINQIIEKILNENFDLIKNQRERSIGPLMGIAMKNLRGKVSGEKINSLLLHKIKEKLQK